VKAEEKNFVLFKFVNEMSNDIEAIEAEVVELQEEVESGMSGPGDCGGGAEEERAEEEDGEEEAGRKEDEGG